MTVLLGESPAFEEMPEWPIGPDAIRLIRLHVGVRQRHVLAVIVGSNPTLFTVVQSRTCKRNETVTKVQEALERHMTATGTGTETIFELLALNHRTNLLLSGGDEATLYEATLLAAYFKTSVKDFIDPTE